jgi:hypothetical protein
VKNIEGSEVLCMGREDNRLPNTYDRNTIQYNTVQYNKIQAKRKKIFRES